MTLVHMDKPDTDQGAEPGERIKKLYRVSLLTDTLRNAAQQVMFSERFSSHDLQVQATRLDGLKGAYLALLEDDEAAEVLPWLPEDAAGAGPLTPVRVFDSAAALAALIDSTLQGSAFAVQHQMTAARIADVERDLAAGRSKPGLPAASAPTPGQYL